MTEPDPDPDAWPSRSPPHDDAPPAPQQPAAGARRRRQARRTEIRLRQPRTGDGELARPPKQQDLKTSKIGRCVRLATVAAGVGTDPCGGCVSGRRAGHQHQSRSGRRAHGTRDPADRVHHGALAGAVDPDHDDLVHAHRGGALAAAHRARHRDRAAQRGDRRARAVPHRLRDGAGAADRLRLRHQAR